VSDFVPRAPWSSVLLVVVLFVAPRPVRADIPADMTGIPVVEVELAGEAASITSPGAVGISNGSSLSRELVRSAIARLLLTGRFLDVQVDAVRQAQGVKLIVWLTPRTTLGRTEIRGRTSVDEQAIRDALGVSPGSEISPAQLSTLAAATAKLYAERGYYAARIETALRPSADPTVKVLEVRIEEGSPTRIGSLRFQGEQPLDPKTVLAIIDAARGDILDRGKLGDGVTRAESWLRTRGFLEAELRVPAIRFRGNVADVVFPARIGPRFDVVIRGETGFPRSEIAAALALDQERLTPTHTRQTLPARLLEFYARRGFTDAHADVTRLSGKQPGRALLVVSIDPGRQLRVAAVSFAGAQHFSREFLKEQLFSYLSEEMPGSALTATVDSEVADEILYGQPSVRTRAVPPLPLTNPELLYYEPAYRKAIDHITELYRGDGYLSARVDAPTVERIGKDRVAVLIPVVEGPRAMLHEVTVRGARAISSRDLLLASKLQKQLPFSYLLLEEARRHVLEAYQERGYMFATLDVNVSFSSDRTRALVELTVLERFPVYIRQIEIHGADRTDEDLIRRVIKFEPGDLFRPALARQSERELAGLQVFSGISIGLKEPELPSRVKTLVVAVNERRSQFLGFSAGLSTGQGIRGGVEYGYRNLFAQAVGLALRAQFAYQLFSVDPEVQSRLDRLSVAERLERRVSIGTTIPRLPGLGRVRTSLDLVHLRSNERDFGISQYALGLTFTHLTTEQLTLTLGGDLENNDVNLFVDEGSGKYLTDPRLRRLLRVSDNTVRLPSGTATLVAGRTGLSYDRRDNAFTPTRGYFFSAAVEVARTLSSEQYAPGTVDEFFSRFVKVSMTGSGYVSLGHEFVVAGQVRIGRIVHLDPRSKTYPTRAFFLGGVDSLRGYLEDELVPQDIANLENLDPNAIVRSGDAFVLYRGELRFPLYRELRGGLFTDLGNLWADAANLDPLELRPTAGVGLRLDTPVGPIALDWGINLNPRRWLAERTSAIHFAIGLF
jgi:outer membrane protein insertion porin family